MPITVMLHSVVELPASAQLDASALANAVRTALATDPAVAAGVRQALLGLHQSMTPALTPVMEAAAHANPHRNVELLLQGLTLSFYDGISPSEPQDMHTVLLFDTTPPH